MPNIKLIIEYDGSNYFGWQAQRNRRKKTSIEYRVSSIERNTIQETLESALKQILQEKVKVTGSGRTDSGVHALAQVANFKTKSKLPVSDIKRALNAVLPDDIAVIEAQEVKENFHSRFDAKSKIYRYTILNSPNRSVMERNFYYFYPYKLDLSAMRSAAKLLLGKKDFKSFQAGDKKQRSSRRHIKNFALKKQGNFIHFEIESDGFLYKMVRNIVGTLLEVGRGKLKPSQLKDVLRSKNRKFAGPTAPAKGLTLLKVIY